MSELKSIMTRFAFKMPDIKPPPIITKEDVRRVRLAGLLVGHGMKARDAWDVACGHVAFEAALDRLANYSSPSSSSGSSSTTSSGLSSTSDA